MSVLVDGSPLFVTVNGYQYCLDALSGRQIWMNPMKGFGYGVTSIATSKHSTDSTSLQASAEEADDSASAAMHHHQ